MKQGIYKQQYPMDDVFFMDHETKDNPRELMDDSFIKMVVGITHYLKISVEMFRSKDEIEAILYVPVGIYFGDAKEKFLAMMTMADEFVIEKPTAHDDCAVKISLRYNLYDL